MIGSFLFYNLLLIFSTAFANISQLLKKDIERNLFFILSFLIVFIPSALRYGIGTDYFNYEQIFFKIEKGVEDVDIEFFYWGINYLVSLAGGGFQWVIAITSFIFTFFLFASFKRKYISIGIFFGIIILYSDSYNILRQMIAVSISLYATSFLLNSEGRGIIYFCGLIIIGTLFHSSCFLGFFIPILMWIKIPRNIWIVLLFLVWFVVPKIITEIFDMPILAFTHFASYGNDLEYSSSAGLGSGVGLVLQSLPCIFVILFSKFIFPENHNSVFFINSAWFYLCLKICGIYLVVIYRLVDYFNFIDVLIMVELCKFYSKSWFNLVVVSISIIVYVFFFEFFLTVKYNEIMPYRMIGF